jgi:hypothetical protein
MIDQATGRLARASAGAASTLRKLLASKDERVKLAAARWILRLGLLLRENSELSERIERLEETLSGRKENANRL